MEPTDLSVPRDIDPGARTVVIGRDTTADFVLSDQTVRPRHARLYRNLSGLHVTAIENASVLVNGIAVTGSRLLRSGEQVRIGDVTFQVVDEVLRRAVAPSSLITVCDVALATEGKRILNGISLSIASGEFVGLLGPSGCGKSTLLRCLLGYLPAMVGEVTVDSITIPQQAARLWERVGYVPQDDILFPTLTVYENLDYSLKLRCPTWSATERATAIARRTAHFRIGDKATVLVKDLSGGERKRVSVAQELLTAPSVLFLDEPTAGLDPANEKALIQELRRIAESGVTVLCATHVLESSEQFHRVVVLARGRVVFDGKPSDMLEAFHATTLAQMYSDDNLLKHATVFPGPPRKGGRLTGLVDAPATRNSLAKCMSELQVFLRRSIQLMIRNPPWLIVLLLQPIVIGLLICLSQVEPTGYMATVTFLAVTAAWLGMNNTSRELVKERAQFVRDTVRGTSAAPYLLSKIVLFAFLGLLQLVLLLIIVRTVSFASGHPGTDLSATSGCGLWLALWITYLGSMVVGLIVSTLSKTQEAALAILPLLILPQLLLTREATRMEGKGRLLSAYYTLLYPPQPQRHERFQWWLEGTSLLTHTRPCIAWFEKRSKLPKELTERQIATANVVNAFHSLGLIVVPSIILWRLFRRRKRAWISLVLANE